MEVDKINHAFLGNLRVNPEEKLGDERGNKKASCLQENERIFPATSAKEAMQKASGENSLREEFLKTTQKLNDVAKLLNTKVRFLYDPEKELVIIKVIEKEADGEEKVLRQIPPEEMLQLAEKLKELNAEMFEKGLFLDQEV